MRYFKRPNELVRKAHLRLENDSRAEINIDELSFNPIFPELCFNIDLDKIAPLNKIKVVFNDFNIKTDKLLD